MKARMICVGLTAACFVLFAGGFVQADTVELFNTNSTNMPADYPQYSYVGGPSSLFYVADNVCYIQDNTSGSEGFGKFTLMSSDVAFVKDPTSGILTIDVDLGCEPTSGGVGRVTTGVMLQNQSGNWLAFRYHPGYTGTGFYITNDSWTNDFGADPGFTPAVGLLQQHMKIEYNGSNSYGVTFSQGASSYTTTYTDTRLGAGGLNVGMFTLNGGGYGTSNFDNLTIIGVPEPASLVLLTSGLLGLLAYAWRRRR